MLIIVEETALVSTSQKEYDDIKDEIQRFCGIAPERQGLHFPAYGAQRRSVRRRIEVLPNMYLPAFREGHFS